jgi:hypothetical protein
MRRAPAVSPYTYAGKQGAGRLLPSLLVCACAAADAHPLAEVRKR